jgi:uncharacterized OsmC-like protein
LPKAVSNPARNGLSCCRNPDRAGSSDPGYLRKYLIKKENKTVSESSADRQACTAGSLHDALPLAAILLPGTGERTMNETVNAVDNGVNVAALLGAREALGAAPEAARFIWRVASEWQNGTHTESRVDGFFGLGEEQKHVREYRYDTDHPEVFASEDKGSTPVEMVLVGLAGCLTAGIAAVAQNRNIQLRSVEATIEAPMDIQGILGIDADVRNGFDRISVSYRIDADASAEDIAALVAQSQKRSAVFDILTNPTDVHVTVKS